MLRVFVTHLSQLEFVKNYEASSLLLFNRMVLSRFITSTPQVTFTVYWRRFNKKFKMSCLSNLPSKCSSNIRNYTTTPILSRCSSVSSVDSQNKPIGLNPDSSVLEDVKLVMEPYNYYVSMQPINHRPLITKIVNYWLNVPDNIVKDIENILTIVYESTFMLDDMDDHSDYRRGLPAGYKLFGIPRTQISGRICMLISMKKIHELNNRQLAEVFINNYLRLWIGTYKELNHREDLVCPTFDEYRHTSIEKSNGIGLLIKMLQVYSNCKTDLSKFGKLMSLHLQWTNDLGNILTKEAWELKGFCEDISEGKFSLAIIHAINTGTAEGKIVFHILRQRTKDLRTLKLCHSLLEKLGSLDFAQKAVIQVENEIREEVAKLGGNPLLDKYLNALNYWKTDEYVEKTA